MTIFNEAIILHHATKGKIDRINDSLIAEWPSLYLRPVTNEAGDTVQAIALMWLEDILAEGIEVRQYEVKEVPGVGDLSADASELGFDIESIEMEEEAASGSVVAPVYRAMYRENSSTKRSCGDWLAEWFAGETVRADGKTDIEEVTAIFSTNGLDMTAKWAVSRGHGWAGRFRMNGRQVLEKQVAWNGYVLTGAGVQVDLPKKDLAILKAKHSKWIAKRTKQEEAAQAVADGADEA
jgi:hypothetical protein